MAAKLETQASFAEEIDFDDLKFEKVVGKGSFGVVSKATWRGRTVAVKMIETEEEIKAFKVEVTQLSRVAHPNIVRLYGACTAGPVCLVMEYAEGGSLYNVLHGNPQPIYTAAHAMSWALQSSKGVAYLHAMSPKALIHRDLKPANLLLMAGGTELKICDFGTACDYQTYMTNNKGSAAWMAPEVFEGSQYSEKCDVFSWGIILWEVISRRKPFDDIGGPAFRIMWHVHQGNRPPKIRGLPKFLDSLMHRCWSKEPVQRPSMKEVVRVIQPLLQYFKGTEQEPLKYPEVEEHVEEPHVSMNLLDLEGATQDTNLTENSEYHGSRASTISDTIIRPQESVQKRDPSGNLKTRDPEYEKRRRSADILQFHGNRDEESFNEEPKAVAKKTHKRSNSHGHITCSSIPLAPATTTKSTSPSPSSTSPTITISVVSPSPPVTTNVPRIPHSKTDPSLSEFDPLMKQRSNSDESHRLLNVADVSGMERPRSGSQGNMSALLLPQNVNTQSENSQQTRPPDKPMRSVSLDQKISQSKVDEDIVIPMAYMTLDHHLQPLPPNPKSKESVEIFDKHCEAAQEYMRVHTELALLHQRKKELAGELDEDWKDQQASFKIIEEFNNLRSEKENLVHMHKNLRAQLDLIRAQVQRKHSLTRRY